LILLAAAVHDRRIELHDEIAPARLVQRSNNQRFSWTDRCARAGDIRVAELRDTGRCKAAMVSNLLLI
jgi:hypothetical protein